MLVDYVPVAELSTRAEMIARQKEIRRRQEEAARPYMAAEAARRPVEAKPTRAPEPDYTMECDPRRIMARIAAKFGVSLGDITGGTMQHRAINARFAAIHAVSRANPHLTPRQLGLHFGGRDRSTIISAFKHMERNGVPQPRSAARREAA